MSAVRVSLKAYIAVEHVNCVHLPRAFHETRRERPQLLIGDVFSFLLQVPGEQGYRGSDVVRGGG
jgi:hypothetical protein